MEQRVSSSLQPARAALHVNAAIFATRAATKLRQIVQMKIDIVGDHQIDQTVAVVIAECRPGGPASISNSRLCGYVGKCSIAVIAIQHVPAEAGDVEIRPAVVVVVGHGATHSETWSPNSSLVGDVGKGSIMIISVESSPALLPLECHIHARRVREVNVQ